jgi:hypothetical protein
MTSNSRIVLASRPVGKPALPDFRLEQAPVPTPAEGEVLLKTLFLSLDPYMRGRMSAARSYADPVAIGAVMEGGTVSEDIRRKAECSSPRPGEWHRLEAGDRGDQSPGAMPAKRSQKEPKKVLPHRGRWQPKGLAEGARQAPDSPLRPHREWILQLYQNRSGGTWTTPSGCWRRPAP